MTEVMLNPFLLMVCSALTMFCLVGWLAFRNTKDREAYEQTLDATSTPSTHHLKHEGDRI